MKIEVLNYIKSPNGPRLGFLDIKVIYSEGKYECFRGLLHFKKENRKWLNFPCIKRDDKYLPYYERFPEVKKEVLSEALVALNDYLSQNTLDSFRPTVVLEPRRLSDG